MQHQPLVIGLFGFGVVGAALYRVLQQTPSLDAAIKKVCIRDPHKSRSAPADLFTTDGDALLTDPEINVIIELTNDPQAAYRITESAFRNGKSVISAGKKMIAENFSRLLALQQETGQSFLYEAAACASIPVIRNLEEYYDNDLLQGLSGIVNGSTNYILTKVFEEDLDFDTALLEAQIAGFAETDASLDIEGTDAVHKLSLLLAHAYGLVEHPLSLIHTGIQNLTTRDARFAREKGYQIRLVAEARKLDNGTIAAFVLPRFVRPGEPLYGVRREFNGVVIESSLADSQFFYGKGAGGFPTASAVLSDLSALRYGYRYEYKKRRQGALPVLADDYQLQVYVSFGKLFQVPREAFGQIDSWSSDEERCHVTGTIPISSLRESNWWKKPGTSLILLPDAFGGTAARYGKQPREALAAV